MAADVNTFALVGRLASDPETRSVGSTTVTSFRFVWNTQRKIDGDWTDKGNFADVKVWGGQGESVARLQSKGKRIGINGRIEVEEWETSDGSKRSKVVLVADRVQFLDPRDEDGGGSRRSSGGGGSRSSRSRAPEPVQESNDDDDIPF